ncbi:KRAB-A domain-containing protein 2, partial [Trichinella zimbabwensis]
LAGTVGRVRFRGHLSTRTEAPECGCAVTSEKEQVRSDGGQTGADPEEADHPTPPGGSLHKFKHDQYFSNNYLYIYICRMQTAANLSIKRDLDCYSNARILQSDNGREFVNSVIKSLKKQWHDLVLVNGRPRHSQSQGSVERANADVQDMLRCYLKDNLDVAWSDALKFVQLQKNSARHRVLDWPPYRALFGCDLMQNACNDQIPSDTLRQADTEEELENAMIQFRSQCEGVSSQETNSRDDSLPLKETNELNSTTSTVVEYDDCTASGRMEQCKRCMADGTPCKWCRDTQRRLKERVEMKRKLQDQADKMVHDGIKKMRPLDVGENVAVPVANLDRARADQRNLLGVVMSENDHGIVTVGTKHGVLQTGFLSTQLTPLNQKFIEPSDVPAEQPISIRTASTKESCHGGQGYSKCSCNTGCITNRCVCKRSGNLCSSSCHSAKTCTNK